MRGDDPLHAARQGGEAGRRLADADRCSTICACTRARPAPRKAAPKAIAAPARWCCGACAASELVYEPVNACIQFAGQVDGSEVVTVEDLARDGDAASGAAGDGRPSRLAMRLLHAGLRDGAVRALSRADGAPVDRAARQRLDRRQSLPLHRLSADRRCGARGLRGAAQRPVRGRRAGDTAARSPRSRDGDDVFVGDERAVLRRARQHRRRWPSSMTRNPDATLVAGATDVGLWVTKQLRDLPKIIWLGRVQGPRRDRGPARRGRASARWSRIAEAMPYLAAIDPRSRRADAPLRRHAGPHRRHRRRQHRQRLADRRHAAGADRARRDARRCSAATGARRCRSRISSSTTASRTARRASSCASVRVPKLGAGRAFPLLQGLQALRPGHLRRDGRVQLRARRHAHRGRAHRLRRHGGDAEARAQRRERR